MTVAEHLKSIFGDALQIEGAELPPDAPAMHGLCGEPDATARAMAVSIAARVVAALQRAEVQAAGDTSMGPLGSGAEHVVDEKVCTIDGSWSRWLVPNVIRYPRDTRLVVHERLRGNTLYATATFHTREVI